MSDAPSLEEVKVQVTFHDGTVVVMSADDEYFHINPDTSVVQPDDLRIDNKRLRLVQDIYDVLLEDVQSL